ncbi:MAG: efflux RND transporter periplasmic adaptor subunit [Ignavibacteria bacterium]|jgi:multidrug efflux pump subunit AcrA (membrane-fusion protein)
MKKHLTWMIAIVILIVGLLTSGILSSQKEELKRMPVDNTKKIKTEIITNGQIVKTVKASGTTEALNKIEIYAEVSGVLQFAEKEFREGTRFSKGEVILKIDDAVKRNQVLAEKSTLLNNFTTLLPDLSIDFPDEVAKWENYLKEFNLEEDIKPLPETNSQKEKYYIAAHNVYSQYYTIKSDEETLEKYTIEAPYDGVVTVSNIIPGSLVRTGQKLGEFINLNIYEIPVNVSIEDIASITVGQVVELLSTDVSKPMAGIIKRINSIIDKSSQTVLVYITSNDGRIKEGMYVTAVIQEKLDEKGVTLSKELIINRNQLYAVEDSTLVLKDIEIQGEDNDKVYVTGLPDGTEILSSTYDNSKNGIKLSEL